LNISPADSGSVNITDGTNTLMSITDVGTVGNATLTGALTVEGNTTLGDAGDDNITINASTVSLSNNLNIDSNTLYIDNANNRVGIGTDSPSVALDVTNGNIAIHSGAQVIFDSDDSDEILSDTYIFHGDADNSLKIVVDGLLVAEAVRK